MFVLYAIMKNGVIIGLGKFDSKEDAMQIMGTILQAGLIVIEPDENTRDIFLVTNLEKFQIRKEGNIITPDKKKIQLLQ